MRRPFPLPFFALVLMTVLTLLILIACNGDGDDIGRDDVDPFTFADETATAFNQGCDFRAVECNLTVTPDGTPLAGGDVNDGAPVLRITSPEQGETLTAGDVTIEVEVDGFELTDDFDQPAQDGQGHLHYYVGLDAPPADGDEPAGDTADTSYTFEDLPAGEHTFHVQLVGNDHAPLDSPVVQAVTVTLE